MHKGQHTPTECHSGQRGEAMSVERHERSSEVEFDFADLEAEVFELVGVGVSETESLTAGHGMTEVAVSCQQTACSCCYS
jgi:hypothetical protein